MPENVMRAQELVAIAAQEVWKRIRSRANRIERAKRIVLKSHKWRRQVYRSLLARLRTGSSIVPSLQAFAESAKKKKRGGLAAIVMNNWAESLRQGKTIKTALDGWIPADELLMLQSDKIEDALINLTWLLDRKVKRSGIVRRNLTAPAISLVNFFAMFTVFGTFVLPQLIPMAEASGGSVPVWLLLLSRFSWAIPVGILAICWGIARSISRWTGDSRAWADQHVWPYTMVRRQKGTSFLIAYAATWSSGFTELTALNVLLETTDVWLRERIAMIAYWVTQGRSFGQALEESGYNFPDADTIDWIQQIEGNPKETAKNLRQFAEEAADEQDERLSQALGAVSMLITLLTIGASLGVALLNVSLQNITPGQ